MCLQFSDSRTPKVTREAEGCWTRNPHGGRLAGDSGIFRSNGDSGLHALTMHVSPDGHGVTEVERFSKGPRASVEDVSDCLLNSYRLFHPVNKNLFSSGCPCAQEEKKKKKKTLWFPASLAAQRAQQDVSLSLWRDFLESPWNVSTQQAWRLCPLPSLNFLPIN